MGSLRTNKPDASRRQLDAAIRMFFDEENELAVLTVVGAAFRVVRDLSAKRGNGLVWTAFNGMIKPGMEKELWAAFNKVPNFLKHADNDPDGVLEDVEAGLCIPMMLFAIWLYADLGYERTPEMVIFILWCMTFEQSKGLTTKGLHDQQRLLADKVIAIGRGMGQSERYEFGRMMLRGDFGGSASKRQRPQTRRLIPPFRVPP